MWRIRQDFVLILAVSFSAAVTAHMYHEEAVDLSGSPPAATPKGGRQRVRHMTAGSTFLGEASAGKAKMNPDCTGPAIPACQHGAVDMDACKCKCPWNWMGEVCEKCNPGACKNGGAMETQECVCKCKEGFSGENCGKGSKCLNGATLQGTTCKCTNGWSGDTCNVCDLVCKNGAALNKKNCVCQCPANRKPPDCGTCQDPGCANGGIYQDKVDVKTNKPLCGCRCPEHLAWSGLKCDVCKNPGCENKGVWNQKDCKCECSNENWQGAKCNKCTLHCGDGKRRDDATCTCVDGVNGAEYNPCKKGCAHGTLDPEKCTCECEEGFKGIFCDKCEREKCLNYGELQATTDCSCKCKEPWQGEICETCPLECGAHGKVKDGCAGCICATTPTGKGKWTGAVCDKCEHPKCKNGGTLNEAECKCDCAPGYSGDTCDTCSLTQAECKHGSKLVHEDCRCDCDQGAAAAGDWAGQLCDQCSIQDSACSHGGVVDKATCRCRCVPLWAGRYCKACDHAMCGAQGQGAGDKRGVNGISEKPADASNCAWIKQLGCPGGLN